MAEESHHCNFPGREFLPIRYNRNRDKEARHTAGFLVPKNERALKDPSSNAFLIYYLGKSTLL